MATRKLHPACERCHPACGLHQSMGWGPRVNSKEERKLGDNIRLSAFCTALPTLATRPSCRDGLSPQTASQTLLSSSCFSWVSAHSNRKVNIREKNFTTRGETELRRNRLCFIKKPADIFWDSAVGPSESLMPLAEHHPPHPSGPSPL